MVMQERVILHSDLNSFFASVEISENPELKGKCVAVVGDPQARSGIVLAATREAKSYGVRTTDVISEATKKCPELILIQPSSGKYVEYSRRVHEIYERFTDTIESFGIDECWLDVTGSVKLFGDGKTIADEIRRLIRVEIGISASVGVSWNKVFAKLGSDLKKPDATTVISKENYRTLIFPLPASDLLMVGRKMKNALSRLGVRTIGQLAGTSARLLQTKFGKMGEMLWTYANGFDESPVTSKRALEKSVSNSTTTVRDINNADEAAIVIAALADSVATRLRKKNLSGSCISLRIRDCTLEWWGKQKQIREPTQTAEVIIVAALELLQSYSFKLPIRSIGVSVSDMKNVQNNQISLLDEREIIDEHGDCRNSDEHENSRSHQEKVVDAIRKKYGKQSIVRATMLCGKDFIDFDE